MIPFKFNIVEYCLDFNVTECSPIRWAISCTTAFEYTSFYEN